jgi:hypothetical protein
LNPNDPRFFYYRGLAYHRLGSNDLAAKDFQTGSAVEGKTLIDVGIALERIQGPERTWLESFR